MNAFIHEEGGRFILTLGQHCVTSEQVIPGLANREGFSHAQGFVILPSVLAHLQGEMFAYPTIHVVALQIASHFR
jgi:hypothetical protein